MPDDIKKAAATPAAGTIRDGDKGDNARNPNAAQLPSEWERSPDDRPLNDREASPHREREASSSEPPDDPNAADPNARTDMVTEIA